jgi:hypothetical protein
VKSDGVGSAFAGIFACLGLNVAALFFWFVVASVRSLGTSTIAVVAVFGIGISQLAYLIPLAIWARRRAMKMFAAGIVIGAAITFLLNGACWGWFLIAKPRIGG